MSDHKRTPRAVQRKTLRDGVALIPSKAIPRKVLAAYHQAVRCQTYAYALKGLAAVSQAIPAVNSAQDAQDVRKQLDKIDAIVQGNRDQCEGLGLGEIDKHLFEFLAPPQAGLHGDLGAQACFVNGEAFGNDEYRTNAQWNAQYLTYAPRFIAHGLDVGYWPIVFVGLRLVTRTWSVDGPSLPPSLRALPKPDPYRVYEGLRVTYYRSDAAGINPPDGNASLQNLMRSLAQQYHLTPQQRTDADKWAQRVYQQHHADTPPINPWQTKDSQVPQFGPRISRFQRVESPWRCGFQGLTQAFWKPLCSGTFWL